MSIAACLTKLEGEGKITPAVSAQARALWERYQGRFSLDLPAAQADAAAALQAARVMSTSTAAKKHSVAMQVIRQTAAEQEQMAHPWGPVAGAMSQLTRDIYRKGGSNVDMRTQTIREALFARFNTAIEAYKSRMLGFKQDIAGAQQMVREILRVDTGDEIAKAAAKGWETAVAYGTDYVTRAGKLFTGNEEWRLPQFWTSDRVRSFGPAAFKEKIWTHIDSGGLKIYDKGRFEIATDRARIEVLLDKAARDIITEAGSAPVFSKEMRTFLFQDGKAGADAWLDLQGKFGSGQDILATLRNHLGSMAREAALVDVLGPQHAATAAMLAKNARVAERLNEAGSNWRPQRMLGLESGKAIERTYDVLSGKANGVESVALAGVMGSARSMVAGASLGSATVSAVIGDSVTALLAARWNGMEFTSVLGRTIDLMIHDNPALQEDAARLLVTGHAMSDHAIGTVRFADQLVGPDLMKRVSSTVIRASGLDAWTEAIKKAFTLEMLGFAAKQVGRGFDAVDAPFRSFLERNRISAAEWEGLRARPLQEISGAKFFDSSMASEDAAVRKLYEGILTERAFAVLEPDARIRAVTTAGTQAGTIMGEVARNLTLFTSFSQTMVATHLMMLATQDGSYASKAMGAAAFLLLHIAAGAAIVQARQLLTGKDPIDMHNPKFWWQSAVQGGGLGYYGDIIGNAVEGSQRSIVGKFSGPIGGLIDDAGRAAYAVATKGTGGIGAVLDLGHHVTPGQNVWYARLGLDRLVFDKLQRAIDPDYARSFARREASPEKAYGQGFWWAPGQGAPTRAPNLAAGLGGR